MTVIKLSVRVPAEKYSYLLVNTEFVFIIFIIIIKIWIEISTIFTIIVLNKCIKTHFCKVFN